MIVKQYIKDFEQLGFGMFVHFGLYSEVAGGEWSLALGGHSREEYYSHFNTFCPETDWAKRIVATAKAAGCKYITLTSRHHDGFSLYDTCGLTDFDAPHSAAGRDLVREFVDACNEEGIIPFFYHTLLDWYVPSYKENFKEYLVYLRKSVELLCKNYGKIGGIWFDGMWDRPDADWEEDALYSMMRSYQPEMMIINNTGLSERGALGHIELDSVTFERGKPSPINLGDSPKYIASEMCQVLGSHWGYAARDFKYKSLKDIIEDLCSCRRYGANLLLNVGPMSNGYLRRIDEGMFLALGEWIEIQKEALYAPRPTRIEIAGARNEKDFLLCDGDRYYLFCHDIPMKGDGNVVISEGYQSENVDEFTLGRRVRSAVWIDSGEPAEFAQNGDKVTVVPEPFKYGVDLVVRVAKIDVE